jgi:hypothetical protein
VNTPNTPTRSYSSWITRHLDSMPPQERIVSRLPTMRPESRLSIPSESVFSGLGCGSNTKDIIANLLLEVIDAASDSLAEDL